MNMRVVIRNIAVLVVASFTLGTQANSFGFEQSTVLTPNDTFSVSVGYDFTEFAMFGGRVNIVYDPAEIEFVGFVAASLPPGVVLETSSPIGGGVLTEPGLIGEFGVVTTNFFDGATSAATLGTFTFAFLGTGSGATPCGATLCIVPSAINPFVSLVGQDETPGILGQGITSVEVSQVPVPAALWLMLGGISLLFGVGRKPQ